MPDLECKPLHARRTRSGTPGARGVSCLAIAVASASLAFGGDLDFERGRMKDILASVSREIEKNFYDPSLKGLDWKALTGQAALRIDKAQSAGEMLTAIFGLVDNLKNSHTLFLPPAFVNRPLFGFEAKAYGDEVRIWEIKDAGRAAAAGLVVGDRILAINGYDVDRTNIDLTLLFFRALRPVTALLLRVQSGSAPVRDVRLEAEIEKGKTVVRDLTQIENVYQLIRELENERPRFHTKRYDDGIGYLGIVSFAVAGDFLQGLVKAIRESRAVIVDLRGNAGGSTDSLAWFAGHFVDRPGSLGDMLGRKKTEPLKLKPREPGLAGPLFVLVDSQSASCSEVFARHFQRTGRATVIGDRTAGRASVSRFLPGTAGVDTLVLYGVQVATARMLLDGEELEGTGVAPDRLCFPTADDLRNKRDPCLALALAGARKALGIEGDPGPAPAPLW